jgi:type IV secretion system protein TrbH
MRYKIALLILGMAAGIAGCATQPTVSKQIRALEMQVGQAVAVDGVNTMAGLYPPAQTHLVLLRAATDEFGAALVSGLRERGYAVTEPDIPATNKTRLAQAKTNAPAPSANGIPFSYRITQVDPNGLYEVVLDVGSNKLARVYVLSDKRINPAGDWTRKE